ncbi:hypothetical protein LCGC14_1705760 [marine sediment metagenome]|uniref:Uncharacterized protein n=1 Tax=marine sediment metagenome TaxID=412755 RepID=A0A0F9KGP2_9ZZZZ
MKDEKIIVKGKTWIRITRREWGELPNKDTCKILSDNDFWGVIAYFRRKRKDE